MKSVIVCLAFVTSSLSLMVIPFSTCAESLEKISAPDLSMIQGKWEGKWERSAESLSSGNVSSVMTTGRGGAEMTIEGERAASTNYCKTSLSTVKLYLSYSPQGKLKVEIGEPVQDIAPAASLPILSTGA